MNPLQPGPAAPDLAHGTGPGVDRAAKRILRSRHLGSIEQSAGTRFDVTSWPVGDPFEDIGEVLNSIISEIKRRQAAGDSRPGAVITIPPGDYRLRTQVRIDVSFLRIEGAGHGFTSSSIRFNVPENEWDDLHELWPGGSRILVDLDDTGPEEDERAGAAFRIERDGAPRISSVEFVDFCIDGLRFEPDGSDRRPQNTYVNGKTGIFVGSPNDSFRINGMGFVYLEHALVLSEADALSVHDNFIAECGSCIELRGWGQASKITDNLIGAGFKGHSIFVEHHGGLLIAANNIFPRGASSIYLDGVNRSTITGNRLHSFYPGMIVLTGKSSENLFAANHVLRDQEPWAPFIGTGNGRDDLAGLLQIDGDDNTVSGNHFSEIVDVDALCPAGATPVLIRVRSGRGNHIANNHIVAKAVSSTTGDSAFAAQVDALLATGSAERLGVTSVQIDPASSGNTILDSGCEAEVSLDRTRNAFRPTPTIGVAPEWN